MDFNEFSIDSRFRVNSFVVCLIVSGSKQYVHWKLHFSVGKSKIVIPIHSLLNIDVTNINVYWRTVKFINVNQNKVVIANGTINNSNFIGDDKRTHSNMNLDPMRAYTGVSSCWNSSMK